MLDLENNLFEIVNDQNIFNLIEQQIDDDTTMVYDPKLFLLPSSYKNVDLINQFNITYSLSLSQAVNKLNIVINPKYGYSVVQQQQAQKLKFLLLTDKKDLHNFFNVQFKYVNESISNFSNYLESVTDTDVEQLSKLKYMSESQINLFQYIVYNEKSSNYNLHFTSPVPLQKLTKDIVIIINSFNNTDSVLKTIHESATVYDRIWIFKICGINSFTNIIQQINQDRQYLSLQSTLNSFSLIKQFVIQGQYSTYVNNKVILKILDIVVKASEGASFIIELNGVQTKFAYEVVIFIFGSPNFIKTDLDYANGNLHIFYITFQNTYFHQINQVNSSYVTQVHYINQTDYINNKLQIIVQILNSLYVSTQVQIGSVNDSIILARPLYKNNQYIGMILISSKIFETFSDIILHNLDGLSSTTLKMRMMEQQIPILNPFYQFSPIISYYNGSSEAIIQTIPTVLNKNPYVQFNDIVSTSMIQITKFMDTASNLYTERLYEYYQMQVTHKELSINIGLSSTAITTLQRFQYSNSPLCVLPQQRTYNVQALNLSNLRQITKYSFQRTRDNCFVSDGYTCLYETNIDLYRKTKQSIMQQINSNILCLKAENFSSINSKFTLTMDTDDFIINLQIIPEFGNINQLILDHDKYKSALLNSNQAVLDAIALKYYYLFPSKIKYALNYDSCVMVIKNNKYISSSQFSSLKQQNTTSPHLLYLLYQKSREILHFARYVKQIEYLLSNPSIKAVYLGHNWVSGFDQNFDYLIEQQLQVENELGLNQDLKIVNKVCTEISRLYFNQYFIFSTNPANNNIVKNEQIKSNIDGTNQKFRLSFNNGQTFLTKPLISKNKSVLGQPQVSGYLTLQLNINDLFLKHLKNNDQKYLIMDVTGSVLYSQLGSEYAFGIKQLLIYYGYLTETLSNATIQTMYRSCSKNHKFWDTAFQRSLNNEFVIQVQQNLTRLSVLLTEVDYNSSAIYERSVIFNASSPLFLKGFITVKEFSVLNQFIVLIQDVVFTNMNQETWMKEQNSNITQYLKNIPQNVSAMEEIYPNLTSRSNRISQNIMRYTQTQYNFKLENQTLWILISILSNFGLISIIILFKTRPNNIIVSKRFLDISETNSILKDIFQFDTPHFLSQLYTNNNSEIIKENVDQFNIFFVRFQQQMLLQKCNYVFEEKHFSVDDCTNLVNLFEDVQYQSNIFRQLQLQSPEQQFRSFTLFQPVSQKYYSYFLMNQKNMPTWIPNEVATFKNNLQLSQYIKLSFISVKRFVSIKERNVSKLATRLQTAIQSTAQSRMQSKPVSRQDILEELNDIPFWFNEDYFKRDNPSPFLIVNVVLTHEQIQQGTEQIINLSINSQ
ncbi:Conserved_hypothetical protein [Hexamita inflata]|uniref:Transmembrane protein n=1 Tax=Hexamita inflata TaxID=28002 RepID=A0AA86QKD9_9EUKA|nr:Conserved hypothetical protein [Hexamita inflata]